MMVEINQFKLNQFKAYFFMAFSLVLISEPTQLHANEVVPLYVEDGNVQVSKVTSRTALGGEVVEYVKKKIDPSSENQTAQLDSVAHLENGDGHSFKTATQSVNVDSIATVKLPETLPKKV